MLPSLARLPARLPAVPATGVVVGGGAAGGGAYLPPELVDVVAAQLAGAGEPAAVCRAVRNWLVTEGVGARGTPDLPDATYAALCARLGWDLGPAARATAPACCRVTARRTRRWRRAASYSSRPRAARAAPTCRGARPRTRAAAAPPTSSRARSRRPPR